MSFILRPQTGSAATGRALRLVLLGTAVAACTAHAAEQESPQHGDSSAELDSIIVTGYRPEGYGATHSTSAGKMPLPIMKTPQAVIVIPQQVIEDFQPIFLDDVLRSVSGINQTNTFGNTADGITVRGFQPSSYFRNGVRTLASRNLTPSTERIEVLKGPSSLLYGNVEPGGLINIISKHPVFDEAFTHLQHQTSNRGGNRWHLDTGAPLGQGAGGALAYRLIVDRDSSDYWRNFGSYNNTFISPMLSWRSERLRIHATYEFTDHDGPFDRGTVVVGDEIADIPQPRRLGERFERLAEKINLGELDLEFDATASTTLRLRAAYQDRESDDLQARPRRVTVNADGNPVLVRRVDGTFGRYAESHYLSASVLQQLETGPLAHQVLVGTDYERTKDGRAGFLLGPDESVDEALDIFDPVYGTLDPASATPIDTGRFAGSGDTTGLYIQDVVSIGSAWTLLLGGRYESYDSRSVTENVPSATISDDSTFLPRAGVVFQLLPWTSLYLSYAESFSPNVFSPDSFAPGSPTAFDPEQGVSREAGMKLQWQHLQLTTALFDIRKRNVLQVENTVPRLIDSAEVQGFEFDLAGELTPELSVLAAYTYQDSDDGEGRPIRNVARHTVGLTATWRWLDGALTGTSAGVSAQYVDDRDGGSNPSASPGGPEFFRMPQYTVVDLFVAYRLRTAPAPVHLQVNLKNALDENYFASSGGSLRINPGQSRTLYATINVRF